MKITYLTTSDSKFAEIKSVSTIPVIRKNEEVPEIQSLSTTEVISVKLNFCKDFELVDDMGLYISALGDFPGALTKGVFESIGSKGILRLLSGKKREARFQVSLGIKIKGKKFIVTKSREGKIGKEIKDWGESNYGFNLIFVPLNSKKYLSEYTQEEKLADEPRIKAYQQLETILRRK